MTRKSRNLPFGILAIATLTSAACAQRDETPAQTPRKAFENPTSSSLGSEIPTLVALQEITLPPIAQMDIHPGSVALGAKPGCAQNPPIYVIADEGVSENIVQGDYVLNPGSDHGSAIVAALIDPNTFGPAVTGATDALIVIDTWTIQGGSWHSQNSQTERLFSLARRDASLRLAAKPIQFSVCKANDQPPSATAIQIVQSNSDRRSVWLTQLPMDSASMNALTVIGDPTSPQSERSAALGTVASIESVRGSGIAIATAPSGVPSGWTSQYTARAGAWDNCARLPSDQQNVQCSAGAKLNLIGLVPSSLRILGPDTERYVRIRLSSDPIEANIFSGAVKQPAKTNTAMDILAEEVPKLRLEKPGFEPCPYGPRWVIRRQGTGRKTIDATCTLVPRSTRR